MTKAEVSAQEHKLGVVVWTLNMADSITEVLEALKIPQTMFNLHIVVMDGGSTDDTVDLAQAQGADVFQCEAGRGTQISLGIEQAIGDWLMILPGDTVLSAKWPEEAYKFIITSGSSSRAGYFRFQLRSTSRWARMVNSGANFRAEKMGLPYGEQGLLISRLLLVKLGGYRRIPVMEDVDIDQRIGAKNLVPLAAVARVNPGRYQKAGYAVRSMQNVYTLMLFKMKFPPDFIARQHE